MTNIETQLNRVIEFDRKKLFFNDASILRYGLKATTPEGRNQSILISTEHHAHLIKFENELRPSSMGLLNNEHRFISHLNKSKMLNGKIPNVGKSGEGLFWYYTPSGFLPFAEHIADNPLGKGHKIRSWMRQISSILTLLHDNNLPEHFDETIPWVFTLDAPKISLYNTSNPAAKEVIRYVQNSAPLLNLLDSCNKSWKKDTLIHGDCRFENWLIHPDKDELLLIDFETCRLGDSRWDTGAVLSEPFRRWVFTTTDKDRKIWGFMIHIITSSFNSSIEKIDLVTARYIIAWLIQRVFEFAQGYSGINQQMLNVLQFSENLAKDPDQLLIHFVNE